MSRYILKKDLPFADAGKEVKADGSGIYIKTTVGKRQLDVLPTDPSGFGNNFANEIERLISQGWIEEVKPREWYLGIANNGEGAFAHRIIDGVEHEYGTHMAGLKEIIKVREVIE
jgi:hypothetical protein